MALSIAARDWLGAHIPDQAGRTVLITGAAGFLGQALLRALPAEKAKGDEPPAVVVHTSGGLQTIRFAAPAPASAHWPSDSWPA